jgi:predicted nucleotidyltransferase component of viral defense system
MRQLDLREQARQIAVAEQSPLLQPVIEKELLHYEMLAALDNKRLLDGLVFQGGTCLRLCYGAERYSEDLDFAGGTEFNEASLLALKDVIEEHISKRYDVRVSVSQPRAFGLDRPGGVIVRKWQVSVISAADRPDIPQQRIKLEVANVASHTQTVRPLLLNYDKLPSGYSNVLIQTEALEEIAADKLVALACASHIRHRDIWDLRWLRLRPHFDMNAVSVLVQKKLEDYGVTRSFHEAKARLLHNLHDIVQSKGFSDQMGRFLPAPTVSETLRRPQFLAHLESEIAQLYELT